MADASVHVLLNVDFKDTYAAGSKRDTQLPHQRGNRKGTQHQGSGGKNHGGNRLQGRTEMGCKQTGRHAAQVDGCNQTAQPGMAS